MQWFLAWINIIVLQYGWAPILVPVILLDLAFLVILERWDDVRRALWGR